jgi:hypothetical protein
MSAFKLFSLRNKTKQTVVWEREREREREGKR